MTDRPDATVLTHPFGGLARRDASVASGYRTMVDEPLTDTDLEELCTRRLDHARFRRLFIEATYAKTRSQGVARFETIVGLIGQRVGGGFEVLGFDVGDSEDRDFWSRVLFVLRLRGFRGLREVVTEDDHGGLADAVQAVYPGVELTVRRTSDGVTTTSEIAGEHPCPSASASPGSGGQAPPGAASRPGGVRSRRAQSPPAR